MTAHENGWWSVAVTTAGPGSDYCFAIDAGKSLPDPRSRYQPNGINGPSRIIDQAAFSWTDQRWQACPLPAAILYELHIGTFTSEGTFRSAIAGLQHLVELGITHVELTPIAEFFRQKGLGGYDGVDLFAPRHGYGGPEELKHLVNACHELGLATVNLFSR
jgi:maltooligosyltrehalose trehalohydrolase